MVKSLEAAPWIFWTTDTFEEAILKAVNLGDDSDTTAAVCGQVVGAFYGEQGIPVRWKEQLVMNREIRTLAERLHQKGMAQKLTGNEGEFSVSNGKNIPIIELIYYSYQNAVCYSCSTFPIRIQGLPTF